MSSWVPTAPLCRENVPLWSSIHREGELLPVPTQGPEQQLCLVLWAGNSREFSGSHRMAQGATATTLGDIVQHNPITSGRIHRSITPTAPCPWSILPSIQGRVESFQGWDFGDTHPRELSSGNSGCVRHGLSSSASPGEPEGTQTSHCTSQEGWDSQNRSREGTCVPRLAKKKLSSSWGPVVAHAGSDQQLQQHTEG